MKASSEPWQPTEGIKSPCADIELEYRPHGIVKALMRFSGVKEGGDQDLELVFTGVIAMHWESESYGIKQVPEPLPKLQATRWNSWSFPLVIVQGSEWLAEYSARDTSAESRSHFALISMNDEVQILALPVVSARWVPASAVQQGTARDGFAAREF